MWGDGVNLYVADATTIRRIELATAQVTTLSRRAATGLHRRLGNTGFNYDFVGLYGLWSDGASLYGTDIGAGIIRKIDLTTGGVQNVASGLGFAWGLSGSGTTLYAALAAVGAVMQVNAVTGAKSQFASTGFGTPIDCHLGSGCLGYFVPGPRSMWSDGQNLYITGYSGTVKKLDIASGQQTFGDPIRGYSKHLGDPGWYRYQRNVQPTVWCVGRRQVALHNGCTKHSARRPGYDGSQDHRGWHDLRSSRRPWHTSSVCIPSRAVGAAAASFI